MIASCIEFKTEIKNETTLWEGKVCISVRKTIPCSGENYFFKGNKQMSFSLSQTSKCGLMSHIILSVTLNFSLYFYNFNLKVLSLTLGANVHPFQILFCVLFTQIKFMGCLQEMRSTCWTSSTPPVMWTSPLKCPQLWGCVMGPLWWSMLWRECVHRWIAMFAFVHNTSSLL